VCLFGDTARQRGNGVNDKRRGVWLLRSRRVFVRRREHPTPERSPGDTGAQIGEGARVNAWLLVVIEGAAFGAVLLTTRLLGWW